jgi:hypothetical protein
MSGVSWPTSPTISCNLRTFALGVNGAETGLRAGNLGPSGSAHLCLKIVVSPVRVRVSPLRKPRCHRGFLPTGVRTRRTSLGHGLGHKHSRCLESE